MTSNAHPTGPPATACCRREFIRKSATSSALLAISPALGFAASNPPTPGTGQARFGSNIYGWGQYAQRDQKKLEVEEVISALRDCGFDYLENFMDLDRPENNAKFADQLKAKGLQPVSLYTGAPLHEADRADDAVAKVLTAAKLCHEAGFRVISCNPNPIGREKTDAELKTQVAALTKLGAGLNALGLKLGIHHHMPEMTNQAREFHYNFRHTQPEVVGFCYDVHWVWKGGVPPMDALKEYGNRVVTWHLRQSRDGIWWEDLDSGDIDYSAVAKYARDHHLPPRYTVELALENGTKITRSGVENHRRSLEYVKRVFAA